MQFSFLVLALAAALAAPAADFKYVVEQSGARIPASRSTVYVKGDTERRDAQTAGAEISTITRCAKREVVTVNWKCATYHVEPLQPAGTAARPGGVVLIERQISDTGERATMLGLPARRMLLRMKLQPQPGACIQGSGEMEQDIWLADAPGAQLSCGTTLAEPFPQSSAGGCQDRYQVTDRGDAALLAGLPVRTAMSFVRPGVARDMGKERALAEGTARKKAPAADMITEVKEISTSPVDSSLFEVPANFKPVKSTMELYSCGASIRP